MIKSKYKTAWLTLNRECNLRCEWCYAKDTKFNPSNNLDLQKGIELIDLYTEAKVKNIVLIGGEPTLSNNIIKYIKKIKQKGILPYLVTNGLNLTYEYLNKLRQEGLYFVVLSLKGGDKESFKEVTSVDKFENQMIAISNLVKLDLKFSISYVITLKNINKLPDMLSLLKLKGVQNIALSFCTNFSTSEREKNDFLLYNDPIKLVNKFSEIYEELHEITGGRFTLSQSLPMCIWPTEVLKKLKERSQLSSICMIYKDSGIAFNEFAELIPCNSLHNIKIGQLNEEFSNFKEFEEYKNSKHIKNIYKKLVTLPDEMCTSCEYLGECAGGCVFQYTNYTLSELLQRIKNEK